MPNWTTNYTTFVGSQNTINTIHSYFDVEEDVFDFDKVVPMPEALRATASPVHIIADDEFKEEHGVLPETLEEVEHFLISYKAQEEKAKKHSFGVQKMTQTMSATLLNNYGTNNWYDWHVNYWSVKWEGCSISIEYKSDNILLTRYDTPWSAPDRIFEALENKFEDLTVLNMARFEGMDDNITATWGDDHANKTYWTIRQENELDVYDDVTEDNIEFISTWVNNSCEPDLHNLETMHKHGFFIDNWSEAQFFPGFTPEKKEADAD